LKIFISKFVFKDGKLIDQKIKNHFVRGAPFHLKVILSKAGMSINVNCHGPQNLDAEFAFENPHFIKVDIFQFINSHHTKFIDHRGLQIFQQEFHRYKCFVGILEC
jgi:hypothetical protein